jgi:hypothetical protein
VRIIVASAAIAFIAGVRIAFTEALILVSTAFAAIAGVLRAAGLRCAAAGCGRAGFAEERRLALADGFLTDLRADLLDFFRAPAAVFADRPEAFADALLMGG